MPDAPALMINHTTLMRLTFMEGTDTIHCPEDGCALHLFKVPKEVDFVMWQVWTSAQMLHEALVHPKKLYEQSGIEAEDAVAKLANLYGEAMPQLIRLAALGLKGVLEDLGMWDDEFAGIMEEMRHD